MKQNVTQISRKRSNRHIIFSLILFCYFKKVVKASILEFHKIFKNKQTLQNRPSLCCYFTKLKRNNLADFILKTIAIGLLAFAILFHERDYTFYTFFFTGFFIFILFYFKKYFLKFNVTAFLISYIVILIPFLIVNGFLTAIPVVIYNNSENLNIRIYSIPFEDVFYGMLLIMMNIAGYLRFK